MLFCDSIFFAFLQKLYIYNTYDGHTCYFCNRNIPTGLNSKPYVRSRRSGAWRWAPTVLILAFLFSNPDVCVHVLKEVQLIRTSRVCCMCGSQMSYCVNTNLKVSETVRTVSDGDVRGSLLLLNALLPCQSGTVNVSSRVTSIWWILFLTYIVRTYEHDRQHMAQCEGIPKYLQPDGGRHHPAHYNFAAGCPSDNVEQFI